MKKKIALFLFDGFSDWEIAYLTPEINRSEQFVLVPFSADGKPVTSMGGLYDEARIEQWFQMFKNGIQYGKFR